MTRDPRVDPQPGDRLSLRGVARYVVAVDDRPLFNDGHVVWLTEFATRRPEQHSCSLAQWRRSMKAAEVLP